MFYWLRDKKSENAELDFLTDCEGDVLPIEVKAGKAGTLKSLIQFIYEKKREKAVRLDLQQRDFTTEEVTYNHHSNDRVFKVKFSLLHLHLGLIEKINSF